MKAIAHREFGAPERVLRFEEVDRPQVGDGEVLVRVRAAGVAKGDWLITEGLPYIARPSHGLRAPKHPVAGQQLAGVVEAVGAGVTRYRPGDEVFGWARGAFAEYAAVPEDSLAAKPAGLGFEEAATAPVSGVTALQAVRDRGEVTAGRQVLVIGASGGVGSFAVQIAKALGAGVTGVAGPANLDLVRSIGADHVIDYTREEITDPGRRYDVVVDIAGNRPVSTMQKVLEPGGTLVIVGGSGSRLTMGFGRTIGATLRSPFTRQRLRAMISSPNRGDLETLAELMAASEVAPVIGSVVPLAGAAEAVDRAGAGGGPGSSVVTV